MNQPIDAAKVTIVSIVGHGANYMAVATSAAGISQQFSQTHSFLYLDLPLWVFFVATLVLAAIGSLASLYTDVMQDGDMTAGMMAVNLVLGFVAGNVGAFILLPVFTENPPMPLVLLTALIMSFIGTVIIKNIGEIVRSAEMSQALKSLFIEVVTVVKDLIVGRIKAVFALFFGGGR